MIADVSTMSALVRDIAGTPCTESVYRLFEVLFKRNYSYFLILSRNYDIYRGLRIFVDASILLTFMQDYKHK